jgi:4-oxalocrotonate tautomerase
MPHVIVKLWPGKSEDQKRRLAERITQAVVDVLGYGEESVSVAMQGVTAQDWKNGPGKIYKNPGYRM